MREAFGSSQRQKEPFYGENGAGLGALTKSDALSIWFAATSGTDKMNRKVVRDVKSRKNTRAER